MDGEGTSIIPITYRPIVLFSIGIWGWALNLLVLSKCGIDPVSLLQLHQVDKHTPLYKPVFFLAGVLSLLVMMNLVLFNWYAAERASIAVLLYISALGLLFWPGKAIYRIERVRFIRMLKRVISLNLFAPVFFSDVILADMLTSFSNVFGDFFVASCVVFAGQDIMDNSTTENILYRDFMVPLLISLPYLIRLKQCISEYIESKENRHVFNALKYASSIPVVIFSAVQRKASIYITQTGSVPTHWYLKEDSIFRFWILFVFINSMYSFWWDISLDWNLVSISLDREQTQPENKSIDSSKSTSEHKRNTPVIHFRRQLYFSPHNKWYTIAIFIDFLLRITWSLKLSSNNIYIRQVEKSVFLIELLEVIRRWIWVIFRMESEWVKKVYNSLPLDNLRLNLLDRKTASGILSPIVEED